MEAAVGGVGQGFLVNSGQICAAASRVLVQEDIAPKFQEAVKAQFEAVSKGLGSNPLEPTTTHGPVVDKAQYDRVMSYIDIGKNDAQLLTGGERKGDKGCLIEPTIFVNPKEGSKIWTEEIFGPVLSMQTFKTEEEAVELANNSSYGLSSVIYTKDLNRALRVSSALETGGVSINSPSLPNVQTPFGGTKQSGTGRELGEEGLKAYLEPKTIHIK
jgi:aldehyde dehydrogenase (NAD+)